MVTNRLRPRDIWTRFIMQGLGCVDSPHCRGDVARRGVLFPDDGVKYLAERSAALGGQCSPGVLSPVKEDR